MPKAMPKLAHREWGEEKGGSPLVILHGMLGSSRNWQTAGRDLAQWFRVFALDLRNHGESFHAWEMDYATLAADVLAWMDEEGIERAHVLGHSMGGKVAMRLAMDHADRVRRLVVVDIAPRAYPGSHGLNFGAMRRIDPAAVRSRSEAEELIAHDVLDWGMRQFLLTNLERRKEGVGFRWVIHLEALTAALPVLEASSLRAGETHAGEVLFVVGGRSSYFLPGDEDGVRRHFPQVQWLRLEASGHNPHFDAREDFVCAVAGFLRA